MKKIGVCALALLLSACAIVPRSEMKLCDSRESYQKGFRDGQRGLSPQPEFAAQCAESAMHMTHYQEGYEAAKSAGKVSAFGPSLKDGRTIQAEPSWVCEVEASAKVFTGVGPSMDEALRSAQSSCGAHFQASSCSQSECKQAL